METLHFTKLRELAHRGPIERGKVYIKCHTKVGDFREDFIPLEEGETYYPPTAYAREFVAGSGIVYLKNRHGFVSYLHQGKDASYWMAKQPRFLALSVPWWDHFHGLYSDWWYASDAGLWEVEGVAYKNKWNYLLDKNALLREGIMVNTEQLTYID